MNVTLRTIRDVFFDMEVAEGLFERQLRDGTYYWDLVRLNVFSALHERHGGSRANPLAPQSPSIQARARGLLRGAVNALTIRYIRSKQPAYLFITNQRVRRGSRLVDNIADHVLDLVSDQAVAFEIINRQAINYWNLALLGPTRLPLPSQESTGAVDDLQEAYETVTAALQKHFSCALELRALIEPPVATFRRYRGYFRRLFEDYRPKAVVLVNNGMFKGLFAAAREKGIPTVELQHGASCPHNVFWSYPGTVLHSNPGLYVPTAYWTFGDYWTRNVHYPVAAMSTVGNDFFHQAPTEGDDDQIVIISAHMFHEELLALAADLAVAYPGKTIYYKLHPHQYKDRASIAEQVSSTPNVVVVADEVEAVDLFVRCGFVIGVHSTLLYAALDAGKRVCIYELYHYFWHQDIFDYTAQFATLDELRSIIDGRSRSFASLSNRPFLFEPFVAERVTRALGDLTGGGPLTATAGAETGSLRATGIDT